MFHTIKNPALVSFFKRKKNKKFSKYDAEMGLRPQKQGPNSSPTTGNPSAVAEEKFNSE